MSNHVFHLELRCSYGKTFYDVRMECNFKTLCSNIFNGPSRGKKVRLTCIHLKERKKHYHLFIIRILFFGNSVYSRYSFCFWLTFIISLFLCVFFLCVPYLFKEATIPDFILNVNNCRRKAVKANTCNWSIIKGTYTNTISSRKWYGTSKRIHVASGDRNTTARRDGFLLDVKRSAKHLSTTIAFQIDV